MGSWYSRRVDRVSSVGAEDAARGDANRDFMDRGGVGDEQMELGAGRKRRRLDGDLFLEALTAKGAAVDFHLDQLAGRDFVLVQPDSLQGGESRLFPGADIQLDAVDTDRLELVVAQVVDHGGEQSAEAGHGRVQVSGEKILQLDTGPIVQVDVALERVRQVAAGAFFVRP